MTNRHFVIGPLNFVMVYLYLMIILGNILQHTPNQFWHKALCYEAVRTVAYNFPDKTNGLDLGQNFETFRTSLVMRSAWG